MLIEQDDGCHYHGFQPGLVAALFQDESWLLLSDTRQNTRTGPRRNSCIICTAVHTARTRGPQSSHHAQVSRLTTKPFSEACTIIKPDHSQFGSTPHDGYMTLAAHALTSKPKPKLCKIRKITLYTKCNEGYWKTSLT